MTSKASPRALALAKLTESGLDAKAARQFGFEFATAAQTAALAPGFLPLASLKLNYFTPSGAPMNFYRVRYLEAVNGFDALTTAKPPRYAQPPNTAPEVYWPRSDAWKKLAFDPSQPVHLTEGELKACCATLRGFPTIAVGGAWSWRSAKRGEAVVASLTPAGFVWKARQVYVVFDSDLHEKPDVAQARLALCNTLTSLGARPSLVTLPALAEGKKTGLDDFLVARGDDAYLELVVNAESFASARELWQLNREVVYVKDPGLIVVLEDGRRMSAQAFVSHAFANRHYSETQIKPDGGVKLVKKPLAKGWIEWPQRAELRRMTYAPGEEKFTATNEYNLWQGWGCDPRPGDAQPWHELLDFLFARDPKARRWFEQWCAWPLQNPGQKLYTAAVVWGVVHGTGKSLVGYSLGRIYGRNFTEIGEEQLHATFNEWAESKQFVLGDDITSGERRGQNSFIIEKLKNLITQQRIRINAKFVPSFEIPDCINYYFTGNQPDLVFLEDTDRRYFVHEVTSDPLPREFYRDYDRWLSSAAGPPALFDHLLKLDLTGFDPKSAAPWTQAKRLMAVDNKSDLGAWVLRLRETPDAVLRLGDVALDGDLFTSTELLRLYDPEQRGRVTANGLGRELKRAGFRYVNDGVVIMTVRGPQRLYAVRHAEQWRAVKPQVAAAAYNSRFAPPPVVKKKF